MKIHFDIHFSTGPLYFLQSTAGVSRDGHVVPNLEAFSLPQLLPKKRDEGQHPSAQVTRTEAKLVSRPLPAQGTRD